MCMSDSRPTESKVDALKTRGKTAYYKAILAAVQKIAMCPPDTPKWIIALTDGADTEGGEAEVKETIALLEKTPNLNLALITMGSDADAAVLARLADAAMKPKPGNARDTLGKIVRSFPGPRNRPNVAYACSRARRPLAARSLPPVTRCSSPPLATAHRPSLALSDAGG